VHALVFDAVLAGYGGMPPEGLATACAWAEALLRDPSLEADSKDPRLFRNATPEELFLSLTAFWVPGLVADATQERLLDRALSLGLHMPTHEPFDEAFEEETHPLLVDAGWELLPLDALDPVRHRGAIEACEEPLAYATARLDAGVPLQELPVLGLVELLRGVDADGELVEPFVVWTDGNDVYQDYVLRGVLKVAKIGG
jgi:hypothetical protein